MGQDKKIELYLDDMPIAFCVIRVDIDESGGPCDFVFTYVNKEHAALEGSTKEKLLGMSFYDFFSNGDKKWLNIYYQTAYNGVCQNITDYSPEIDKYLLIKTFQPEYGYCGCVLQDITRQVLQDIQIEQSNERTRLLLGNSTDAVFSLDLETETIYNSNEFILDHQMVPQVVGGAEGLLREGLLSIESLETLQEAFQKLHDGWDTTSCEALVRLGLNEQFVWYNVTFSAYNEIHSNKRRVMGFLRNIDQAVRQRANLIREASTDPLTGLYNIRAGKELVCKYLENNPTKENLCAFFMLDLDNFKQVNDTYGHQFGDTVLRLFSRMLRNCFEENSVLIRIGGDEFAGFVHHTSSERAQKICHRIFSELGMLSLENQYEIRTSIGVYLGTASGLYQDFYKGADAALYEVKLNGKNSYKITGTEREGI